MKEFTTTGLCIPSRHYMADPSDKVRQIRKLVDAGKYFWIGLPGQYGKTTTLLALKKALAGEYTVMVLNFRGISSAGFETKERFVQEFCRLVRNRSRIDDLEIPESILQDVEKWKSSPHPAVTLGELFDALTEWCGRSEKKIVLIIDEVDSAKNNQVFLDFLEQLRDGFLRREADGTPAWTRKESQSRSGRIQTGTRTL